MRVDFLEKGAEKASYGKDENYQRRLISWSFIRFFLIYFAPWHASANRSSVHREVLKATQIDNL